MTMYHLNDNPRENFHEELQVTAVLQPDPDGFAVEIIISNDLDRLDCDLPPRTACDDIAFVNYQGNGYAIEIQDKFSVHGEEILTSECDQGFIDNVRSAIAYEIANC